MTHQAANEREAICRVRLTSEGRWVSLALSLRDMAGANRFLVSATAFCMKWRGSMRPLAIIAS